MIIGESMENEKKKKSYLGTILFLILCIIIVILFLFREPIVRYVVVNFVYDKEVVVKNSNEYKKNWDYEYIQNTEDFEPKNKQDLLNILYTVLNNGWESFTFYCPVEYKACISDMDSLTQSNEILSDINNYIHPYNTFDKVYITTNNFGKVNINVEKVYTEEMIMKINQKVEEIIATEIQEDMTLNQKIRVIHDYIIEHTVYDNERAEIIRENWEKDPTYASNNAYGPLIEGKAICGGYADAMAIFLNYFGVKNYKIASLNHVWNYVELDGVWYHLDLTWDDPVVNTGENVLLHNFFLISTEELEKKDTSQHTYDKTVYIEAK